MFRRKLWCSLFKIVVQKLKNPVFQGESHLNFWVNFFVDFWNMIPLSIVAVRNRWLAWFELTNHNTRMFNVILEFVSWLVDLYYSIAYAIQGFRTVVPNRDSLWLLATCAFCFQFLFCAALRGSGFFFVATGLTIPYFCCKFYRKSLSFRLASLLFCWCVNSFCVNIGRVQRVFGNRVVRQTFVLAISEFPVWILFKSLKNSYPSV